MSQAAVLEQRVARIYRIGQENPVQIINLVSKNSIEEGMIEKLRFKSSMFEGVLDGGADTVFADEDKFKKFMEDVRNAVNETPVAEDANDMAQEEEDSLETVPETLTPESGEYSHITPSSVPEDAEDSNLGMASSHDGTARTPISDDEPVNLINQGISFLSGLAKTLKSPEATGKLVDSIVEVDKDTGQANIKIPVASKETVTEILSLFGKLLQK